MVHAWEAGTRDKTFIPLTRELDVPPIVARGLAACPDRNSCTPRMSLSAAIQVRSKTEHLVRNGRYIRRFFFMVHEHGVWRR